MNVGGNRGEGSSILAPMTTTHGGQEIVTSRELRFNDDCANLSRLFGIREGIKDL